jgi:hypothetical protein
MTLLPIFKNFSVPRRRWPEATSSFRVIPKRSASFPSSSRSIWAIAPLVSEKSAVPGRDRGRFDPSEFGEFNFEEQPDGDGDPGAGGINRGRGDADLTWGDESLPFDRFKSVSLPPGAVRSPDDWAPVAALPGAPKKPLNGLSRPPA